MSSPQPGETATEVPEARLLEWVPSLRPQTGSARIVPLQVLVADQTGRLEAVSGIAPFAEEVSVLSTLAAALVERAALEPRLKRPQSE